MPVRQLNTGRNAKRMNACCSCGYRKNLRQHTDSKGTTDNYCEKCYYAIAIGIRKLWKDTPLFHTLEAAWPLA